MPVPKLITFTGVGADTPVADMRALAARYPIEWGVLLSEKRAGVDPRYMMPDQILALWRAAPDLRFAAHLCGDIAMRTAWRERWTGPSFDSDFERDMMVHCRRAQVNLQMNGIIETALVDAVAEWAGDRIKPILQCRGNAFPENDGVAWLFDRSGGRGVLPTAWATPPRQRGGSYGYAGGIRPENLEYVLAALPFEEGSRVERDRAAADDWWIDMESGVRDQDNRFCLRRCAEVCRIAFRR